MVTQSPLTITPATSLLLDASYANILGYSFFSAARIHLNTVILA